MSKNNPSIMVVGCKHTTKELIEGLLAQGFKIDYCLTLNAEKAQEQEVAGYYDLREFLKCNGIKILIPNTYSLKKDKDQSLFENIHIDVALVNGWQRLIPDWLLDKIKIGAFGMHGSSKPLPHGRGRSPMNWSLIQNKNEFYTHLFKYAPGVDDGPVVGQMHFEITQFDDCHTLHLKNTLSMVQLCKKYLPNILENNFNTIPQSSHGASYYPKRTAEDGIIFWSDASIDLYNLIRAVTHPFPGAFTYLNNDPQKKITIWKAIPFDSFLQWNDVVPGQVLEVFLDGSFLVKTGDSTILVKEHECSNHNQIKKSDILSHAHFTRKIWDNLPS